MKTKQQRTICVISLTWNRPEYIKRSFESLYSRAGQKFEHYVFDDCSDNNTIKLLKTLQQKYKFNLFTNTARADIYNHFHRHVSAIPLTFDYYVKIDSDIEILSKNLFRQLIEVFDYKHNVIGCIPRVEGVLNADRYGSVIDFYNGHAIKINSPVLFGCCLMLTGKSFARYANTVRKTSSDRWGIDAEIYSYSKEYGIFLQVEDLSVYHIDNTYGQRRRNCRYFLERKRWQNIDTNETSFLRVSKIIYPSFIKHVVYKKLIQDTISFDNFVEKCKQFVGLKHTTPIVVPDIDNTSSKINVFRVISPNNYPPVKELTHGTFKYYKNVPKWASNNPSVCVELVTISSDEYSRHCQE